MDVVHLCDDASLRLIDLKSNCRPCESDFIANYDAATHTCNHGNGQINLRIPTTASRMHRETREATDTVNHSGEDEAVEVDIPDTSISFKCNIIDSTVEYIDKRGATFKTPPAASRYLTAETGLPNGRS